MSDHRPTTRYEGIEAPARGLSDSPRFAAALLDNLFLPVLLLRTVQIVDDGVPALALWAVAWAGLTWVTEGLTGRSPAKMILGLRTVRVDGGSMDLRTAIARRPWPVLLAVGAFFPPVAIATLVAAALFLLVSVSRSTGRGPHDHLAGTVVGTAEADDLTRRLGLLLYVVPIVGALASFAFAPSP